MSFLLKGIGDSVTGANEIIPSFDAKIFNFISCTQPCVVANGKDQLILTKIDRGVIIGSGMAFAYGYFGISDSACQFNYVIPSSQKQYAKIYAEFNLSTVPQSFSIKMTPQTTTSTISLISDDLTVASSGIFQMPLYLLEIETSGKLNVTDYRLLRKTIGEIELSKLSETTDNPIFETENKKYRPLKYDRPTNQFLTKVTGYKYDRDIEVQLQGRILLWQSEYWYGIGTRVPGMGSPGYLAVEFGEQELNGGVKYYEIVFDYDPGLPESLVKIPMPEGVTQLYCGGRIHIYVSPFVIGNQMNILLYPLGTLTNWANHDDCGSGSALLIANRYPVDGKRGMFFQYIERVDNSNQAQNDLRLIEIYGII